MGWVLVAWVPLVFVGVSYALRTYLSSGPLHAYVQPYSRHAPGEVTFIGGMNWRDVGAGMRFTTPLARLTVRPEQIQLGPSVRLIAAVFPTFVIPAGDVDLTAMAARGPERVVVRTGHGDLDFWGADCGKVAEVLRS